MKTRTEIHHYTLPLDTATNSSLTLSSPTELTQLSTWAFLLIFQSSLRTYIEEPSFWKHTCSICCVTHINGNVLVIVIFFIPTLAALLCTVCMIQSFCFFIQTRNPWHVPTAFSCSQWLLWLLQKAPVFRWTALMPCHSLQCNVTQSSRLSSLEIPDRKKSTKIYHVQCKTFYNISWMCLLHNHIYPVQALILILLMTLGGPVYTLQLLEGQYTMAEYRL